LKWETGASRRAFLLVKISKGEREASGWALEAVEAVEGAGKFENNAIDTKRRDCATILAKIIVRKYSSINILKIKFPNFFKGVNYTICSCLFPPSVSALLLPV
tara:strand:+ start:184 stop:492 length:309 start_codon:yes stop_codon:yes gene_type:complete